MNDKTFLDLRFKRDEFEVGFCKMLKFAFCCCRDRKLKKKFKKGWSQKFKGRGIEALLFPS